MPVAEKVYTPTLDALGRSPDEAPISKDGAWSPDKVAEVPNNVTTDFPINLVGGVARGSLGKFHASWYQAQLFPSGDAQAWGKVNQGPGNGERIGVLMHLSDPTSAANIDGYCALYIRVAAANDAWAIWKVSNGSWTELNFALVEVLPQINDYLLLDRVGTTLTFWHYIDSTDTWVDRVVTTDSAFTGGYAGLHAHGDESSFLGFGGGVPRTFLPQIIRYA